MMYAGYKVINVANIKRTIKNKTAKENNTEGRGLTVPELLYAAGMQWQQTENLLRETVLRCNLCMPTTEQETKWFDEGCDITNSGDFLERLYERLDIGQREF